MLLQYSPFREFDAAVESGLSTKSKEDTVRFLFANDLLHVVSCHRKEIDLDTFLRVRLNRCDIWIDKNNLDSFLNKSSQALRPAVIELGSLPNLDRAAAKNQSLMDPFMLRRIWSPP